jgi:hypothetical protein
LLSGIRGGEGRDRAVEEEFEYNGLLLTSMEIIIELYRDP